MKGFFFFFLIKPSALSCSLCVAALLQRRESRCLSRSEGTNLHISCPHLGEVPKSYCDVASVAISSTCETSLMGCRHTRGWGGHLYIIPSMEQGQTYWHQIWLVARQGSSWQEIKKRCSLKNESMLFVCSGEIPAMIITWPRLSRLLLCVSK